MITSLVGPNAFLKLKKLKELKSAFAEKYGLDNIENVNGEALEKEQLPNLLQGGSLFSANRMVVIKNLSGNKDTSEALLNFVDKIPEDISVILVEGSLDKRTVYYKGLKKSTDFNEFEEPKEPELSRWVAEYVKAQSGEIAVSDARLLVDYVGENQERLANEIEKLVAYEPKITKETIEELVERRPQNTVFELLDAVLGGNKKRAQELLKKLEQAYEDPFQIANLLIWQIQVLAIVKSAGERADSEIAKDTKFNPFVISKTKRLARNINRNELRGIIQKTADMDLQIKLSKAEPWHVIEHTILSY